MVICNPHNPIGRVWTDEEMEHIVDLCVQYGVYLLSDEIHADFGMTRPYTTAGRFEKIHDRLVVYTAISKTFNMAGLGSSCMMIPNPELKQKISDSYDACWMFGPCDLAFTAIEAAYTHGDAWVDQQLAKYYAYNKHQMVPDMLVANLKFLNGLSPEEYQIFKDAAALSTEVELKEWDKSIEAAKDIAQNKMGVEFIDVDVDAFKQKVLPLHETMLNDNPKIVDLYNHIQEINEKAKGGKQDGDNA